MTVYASPTTVHDGHPALIILRAESDVIVECPPGDPPSIAIEIPGAFRLVIDTDPETAGRFAADLAAAVVEYRARCAGPGGSR